MSDSQVPSLPLFDPLFQPIPSPDADRPKLEALLQRAAATQAQADHAVARTLGRRRVRLTREQSEQVLRLMRELFAAGKTGRQVVGIINREVGLNRSLTVYWSFAQYHGIPWVKGSRPPDQERQVPQRIADLVAQRKTGPEITSTINQELGLSLTRNAYRFLALRTGTPWAKRRAKNPDYKRNYRQANLGRMMEWEKNYRQKNRDKINERQRQRRAANPEKHRERDRQRHHANAEKRRASTRKSYLRHRDKRLQYQRDARAANPEKFRKRDRERRAANPEKFRKRDKERRAANPEKYKQKGRDHYRKHVDRHRKTARRRAAELRALAGKAKELEAQLALRSQSLPEELRTKPPLWQIIGTVLLLHDPGNHDVAAFLDALKIPCGKKKDEKTTWVSQENNRPFKELMRKVRGLVGKPGRIRGKPRPAE